MIGFEITNACNFDCVHCYLGEKKNRMLNCKYILDTLDKIGNNFCMVYLTGGEPLLHSDFKKIYLKIREKGFIVNIFTNASLISKDMLETFKEIMPHQIEVSLYGMSEQSYRNITKKEGMFNKVRKHIVELVECKVSLLIKFNLMTLNCHELGLFISFCKELGVSYLVSGQIIPDLDHNQQTISYRLKPESMKAIFDEHKLDLKTVFEGPHVCDAGESVYIDSGSIIRGCPVLHTEYDIHLSRETKKETIINVMNSIKMVSAKSANGLCPGWINLESEYAVRSYINSARELI